MAKPVTQKIKLVSSAGTGYYYVTKKNPRNLTEKLALKKYDPGSSSTSNSKNRRSNSYRARAQRAAPIV